MIWNRFTHNACANFRFSMMCYTMLILLNLVPKPKCLVLAIPAGMPAMTFLQNWPINESVIVGPCSILENCTSRIFGIIRRKKMTIIITSSIANTQTHTFLLHTTSSPKRAENDRDSILYYGSRMYYNETSTSTVHATSNFPECLLSITLLRTR